MTPAIRQYLSFEVFSFVVGVVAQPIEEGKSISRDRDGYFGSEFNIAAGLATNNGPDVGLHQADDPVRNTSAVGVVENALLTHQLANHHQLLVPVSTGCEKTCPTSDQVVNSGQIALQMAKLLFVGHTDLADARSLLLSNC